jgi:DNA polymerase-3 subunit delta'
MNLKPFASEGRLAVIPAAERLSLPAANSLLKLAEEPPEEGRLLFLAEEDNLIPTIRSRVWTVYFSYPSMTEETPPPDDPSQWAEWIDKTRKKSLDELVPEIDAWSRKLCGAGEWDKAASVRNAIYISKKRHLPVSMVQDALAAILREGVTIGQIFSDIR